ncbi:MAG: IS1 family transposase [Gemmatimonadetes bacterium]|nr:IS1 family transposase [Gemmatimonadota bacterium]
MNRLSPDRRAAIVRALVDGASIRAACRMTGSAKGTALRLLAEVGEACLDYQRRTLVNLPCKRIQCDEIWSFVGAKEKNTPEELRGTGERGDCWTWTAICADTKLIPCWHVGPRDAIAATIFLEDLAGRLASRVQLTTDGHRAYLSAVEQAFGWNGVDYAMLVKLYGDGLSRETSRRYSPAECVGTEITPIMGNPDPIHVSTSYAERANLTIRMSSRRYTRLTNGYSKKMQNHLWAISLHFMYYNFCRPHHTLTKANGGIHVTPAMAAGVTDRVWKVGDVLALLG